MPLFHVQDSDRPGWIIAKDYGDAERKWRDAVAKENDERSLDVEPPMGIEFTCQDNEIITDEDWIFPL